MNFKPQPGPQTDYFLNPADILIYGGAAGSGKSFSLLLDPVRRLHVPGFTSVIFRRTYPEFTNEGGLWDESEKIYPYLGGVPRETDLSWHFPKFNNSIKFSHLEYEKDKHKYQGAQICYEGYDELTHFSQSQFLYLLSRNRSTCGIKPYVRATCNPEAESWVAEFIAYWIDQETGYPIPERSGCLRWFIRDRDAFIWADSKEELRDLAPYIPDEDFLPKSVTFIPAKLSDNPALLQKDPGYRANLLALNYVDRERLLGGNWKIRFSAGTMFKPEWFQFIDAQDLPVPHVHMELVRSWDTAATEPGPGNPDPDYSAGVLMGEYQGRYYIFDLQHFRRTPGQSEAAYVSTAEMDGRGTDIIMEQEPGSAGKREIDRYKTTLFKGYSFQGKTSSGRGDKVIRAKPFSKAVENGLIFLVRGSWNAQFISELSHFPDKDFHDDITDSAANAFEYLSRRGARGKIDLSKMIKQRNAPVIPKRIF
jgi:predicted phage terminase large subunit-like protein